MHIPHDITPQGSYSRFMHIENNTQLVVPLHLSYNIHMFTESV